LVQRAGQVVSKDELFQAVWPDTVVSEGVLTSRIRELRQALRDPTAKPRYIETVSRRGYRFIAPLSSPQPVQGLKFNVQRSSPPSTVESTVDAVSASQRAAFNVHPAPGVVGREAELACLHNLFEKALHGERQV